MQRSLSGGGGSGEGVLSFFKWTTPPIQPVVIFPMSRTMKKYLPNQQRTLNKLRCRNVVNKHRVSIQIGAKRAKTCMKCVYVSTEFPFCFAPLVVGYYMSITRMAISHT